jgi:hypothetical protein
MRQDDVVDVESVSDELYGLPLEDFIPTRNAREKEARSAEERELAAQIHQLAKPNLVAWLANQLAREHGDEIRPLLELGTGLREATATLSGEQLRELSRQQRQVVSALVQQARRLASAAGRKVSPDTARSLEATLRAALADPDAADALGAGRLTEGMQNSGLGSQPGQDERPRRSAGQSPPAGAHSVTARHPTPKQRTRAEHDVDQARTAADQTTRARQDTHALLDAAGRAVTDTQGWVERASRELAEARQAQSGAEKVLRRAREVYDRADQAARDAQGHLTDATERLDRLGPQ